MIVHLSAAFLAGWLLHKTKPAFDGLGDDLSYLARCSAGMAVFFPFLSALFCHMREIEDLKKRLAVSFWLAVLFYGLGVLAGYLFGGDE